MSRVLDFLRHLVAWERLPRDEVPEPRSRGGLLGGLIAGEALPRDQEDPRDAHRPGFLRSLVAFERLPQDDPAPPPGESRDAGPAGHEGER